MCFSNIFAISGLRPWKGIFFIYFLFSYLIKSDLLVLAHYFIMASRALFSFLSFISFAFLLFQKSYYPYYGISEVSSKFLRNPLRILLCMLFLLVNQISTLLFHFRLVLTKVKDHQFCIIMPIQFLV